MVKKISRGFTLMELLIVIGLIGILIAISVTAYGTIQKKSRDTRRMSDMKAIQNAYEQFYAENNSVYSATTDDLLPYLNGVFPVDPKNVNPYTYEMNNTAIDYCACAKLEASAGNANADDDCAFTAQAGYFCVKNVQ